MRTDSDNLNVWLEENKIQVSTYLPEMKIDHAVIRRTVIIDNIVNSIKKGDLNAIELGCNLTVQNKLIPFGSVLKSKIFRALKNNWEYISVEYRRKLTELVVHYLNSPYPAKENKELCRLVRKFESKYAEHIINEVDSTTVEAKRWLNYLRK